MQIELTKVGKTYKAGNWTKLDIEYVRDGKPSKRTLVAVGPTKDVVTALKDFSEGDVVDVKMEKQEKGDQTYWNWVAVDKIEGAATSAAEAPKGKKTSEYKSTYETPEERAEKNVRISRMSALEKAIMYRPKADLPELFGVAEQFVNFIFQTYEIETVDSGMKKAKAAAKKGEDAVADDLPWEDNEGE